MTSPSAAILRPAFLLSGLCAVACIPGILAAERFGWSERPFHAAQILSALVCLMASIGYLLTGRHRPGTPLRFLAVTAAFLSGSYLVFLAWVIARIDFSGM